MRRNGWVPRRGGEGGSRAAVWRRRLIRRIAAAMATGLAAWWIAQASLATGAPAQHRIVVAARDLATGQVIGADDLSLMTWLGDPPPGALLTDPAHAEGQVLNAPLIAGEPVARSRLGTGRLGAGLPEDQVLVHLSGLDPGLVGLLRAGDTVDVLSAGDGSTLVSGAIVASVPAAEGPSGVLDGHGSGEGGGILLACSERDAARLAPAQAGAMDNAGLMLTLRPPEGNPGDAGVAS